MSRSIEVLEWLDDSGEEMVHRFAPGGEIKMGARLIVGENRAAVFFRDGCALDLFGPGDHALTTRTLPVLAKLLPLPAGPTSPFRADVYFVNCNVFTDLNWGTKEPVVFRDSELHMVRLRASGAYATRVADPNLFIAAAVGSMSQLTANRIDGYLRDRIVALLNDVLREELKTIFDLPQRYDELARSLTERVRDDFARFGLELVDFFIVSITPPEEVQKVLDDRSGMGAIGCETPERYVPSLAAREMEDAGAGGGGAVGTTVLTSMRVGAGAGLERLIPGVFREASKVGAQSVTCTQCGSKRAAPGLCARCGAASPAGARFCPGCGTRL